jgi:hypothetical protein
MGLAMLDPTGELPGTRTGCRQTGAGTASVWLASPTSADDTFRVEPWYFFGTFCLVASIAKYSKWETS